MRSLIALAIVLSSVWHADHAVRADDVEPAVKLAVYMENVRTDEAAAAAMLRWRAIFGRNLQMYVDRMVADFSLDPGQRKHLEVAAKGTIERFMRRWIRSMVIRAILLEERGEDSDALDSILDADELDEMQLVIGAERFVAWVTNDPLWQKAVNKVLGSERFDELRAQERTRSGQFIDRVTDNVIEWLNRQYFFSMAQRKKLRVLVRRELSKHPHPVEGHIYSQFFTLAWAYRVPAEELSSVLTESQMTIWTQMTELHVELLDELGSELDQYTEWFNPDSLTPEQLAKFEVKSRRRSE
ncbi:MAG: hypothetical protein ACYTGL_22175 [Planctomycetota bacterium]|jgi:hypothetical protein